MASRIVQRRRLGQTLICPEKDLRESERPEENNHTPFNRVNELFPAKLTRFEENRIEQMNLN